MSNVTNGSNLADNSLVGLIQLNDKNVAEFTASDLVQPSEFMSRLPFFPASNGTQHKFLVETAAAGVSFRAVNSGVENSAGSEKIVTTDLKVLGRFLDS